MFTTAKAAHFGITNATVPVQPADGLIEDLTWRRRRIEKCNVRAICGRSVLSMLPTAINLVVGFQRIRDLRALAAIEEKFTSA